VPIPEVCTKAYTEALGHCRMVAAFALAAKQVRGDAPPSPAQLSRARRV